MVPLGTLFMQSHNIQLVDTKLSHCVLSNKWKLLKNSFSSPPVAVLHQLLEEEKRQTADEETRLSLWATCHSGVPFSRSLLFELGSFEATKGNIFHWARIHSAVLKHNLSACTPVFARFSVLEDEKKRSVVAKTKLSRLDFLVNQTTIWWIRHDVSERLSTQ